MANRNWKRDHGALEQAVVSLYASVAIGATGAPTLSTSQSKGIASIARNSAGKYTITLSDVYQRLMVAVEAITLASGSPAVVGFAVRADNSATATAPTIVIEHLNSSGTATEVASGATLLLKFDLKNSSV